MGRWTGTLDLLKGDGSYDLAVGDWTATASRSKFVDIVAQYFDIGTSLRVHSMCTSVNVMAWHPVTHVYK